MKPALRSDVAIAEEIAKLKSLKPLVVRWSAWHDDNHAAMDAAVTVLTERLSDHQAHQRFSRAQVDIGDNLELQVALRAWAWMMGYMPEGKQPVSEEGWPLLTDVRIA